MALMGMENINYKLGKPRMGGGGGGVERGGGLRVVIPQCTLWGQTIWEPLLVNRSH